jgi:hypothetical protein
MNVFPSFVDLPDRDLLIQVKRLAHGEREATAALVASLAEVDARALHRGEGCPSLFAYCTRVLQLSESAAYARIGAARAGREFPIILERLVSGELTLTTICLLAPHLNAANHREVLDAARHKSKREVERLVAALHPRPDVASTIRRLPAVSAPVRATRRRPRPPEPTRRTSRSCCRLQRQHQEPRRLLLLRRRFHRAPRSWLRLPRSATRYSSL